MEKIDIIAKKGWVFMYKLCKTEQSAKRQRELEQGLLSAMATHQYEEISVSDLCDHMNIPRKSFYRYFSSKDGALHALIDHTLLDYESFSNGQQMHQSEMERFFRFWRLQTPLLDALARSNLSSLLVTRTIDHTLSDVSILPRYLRHEQRQFREQATVFAVSGLMMLILNWHNSGYALSVNQMADIGMQLLTKPLFSVPDLY